MVQIFKRWYQGKTDIHYFGNVDADNTGVYVFPLVYTEYHWTAQAARHLIDFCLRNWQFIVGTALTIGIAVAAGS